MNGQRRVAVLGTGAMGHPIAQRLADQRTAVRVWNRTEARTTTLSGVERCASPTAAVQGCGYVITTLADEVALRDVLTGRRGVLDRLAQGQLVLNLGTVSPAVVRKLAADVARTGAVLLDVGMLGNAVHALQGELRLYVGGEAPDVQRASGLLHDIAKEVVHVGPVGSGMAVKLVLNLVMGLEMQALAEAAALADGLSLQRSQILDVIGGSGFASPVMRFKARRMTAGNYTRPDFRLALMAKDLVLADDAARVAGLDLAMTSAARQSHVAAAAAGWAEDDCAAIAEALRPTAAIAASGSTT